MGFAEVLQMLSQKHTKVTPHSQQPTISEELHCKAFEPGTLNIFPAYLTESLQNSELVNHESG